jgi:hypothetical protein
MLFWRSEEGAGISALIHDTNGPSGTIRACVSNIRYKLEDSGINNPKIENSLKTIESAVQRHLDAVDAFYSFAKKRYEQNKGNTRG